MASHEQSESAEETLIVSAQERSTTDGGAIHRSFGPDEEREFRRGDEVGRYVILERVGAGGMGVVYAAWDPKLDRKVALKLLHGDEPEHGQRLEREAQAMARLAHPNVITVHDVGEANGRVFVAMEFVEGETLGHWAHLGRSKADEKLEPRSWSEILEVVLAAGRGLAAAHAEGLIHRDFKPDNVMIGADGRVRVMDFGLVRATNISTELVANMTMPHGASPETNPLRELSIESSSVLESQITIAGSLLGTPAYMAPEQVRGEEADARADQFSFCVAVWQCLYGERPFAGNSSLAVLFAITQGQFREPAPGRTVPSWVRRALERGLASDPDARWPDMPSLLSALANDPQSKRRPWLLGTASLALAAAAAAAAIVLEKPALPAPCERAGEQLRELWSEERRTQLAATFASSELVYADETWTRVGARLDDWAQGWIAARKTACEDTQLRHQQSAELLDLRMACLDQRRDRFSALVELFSTADDGVIEKAIEAVEALPTLEVCSDSNWLTATVRPPEDPELAASVAKLREDVARVAAMTDAGKAADAIELAEQLDARAAALGWTPVVAEAAFQLGRANQELGDFAKARTAFERSYFAARRGGHDEVTMQTANSLIYGLSVGLGEFEVASWWIDHALAEAERIGRDDLLAEVYAAIGVHRYMQSELEPATEAFARALELHTGRESLELGIAHINYGSILARVDPNERDKAFAELDLGLRMLEDSIGPQHPSFAASLSNYATVHGLFGERREAIALLERALEIDVQALGEKHPSTGLVELNLANNLVELDGGLERALLFAERSLATHRAVFGDRHVMVAQSERTVAKVLLRLGRPHEAIPHADASIAIFVAVLGDDRSDTSSARLARARCDVALGDTARARASLEALLGHELDGDQGLRAHVLLELAELIVDEDRERAAKLLGQAKPYFDATGDRRDEQRVAALRLELDDRG